MDKDALPEDVPEEWREFFQRSKRTGETREQYARALRALRDKCIFGDATEAFIAFRVACEYSDEAVPTSLDLSKRLEDWKTAEMISNLKRQSSQAAPGATPTRYASASKSPMSRYKKTFGVADVLGDDYAWKMLTLVFLRMLSSGHEFQLASNMAAVGLFDDIVLRHRKDPDHEWDVSYVQLKHKQNKTISKPELLGISRDFSLVKYCASYETMKLSKELLLYGDFSKHEIVIFSNASLDDSLVDVLESDPLLSTGGRVVSFKTGGEVYQGLCEWVDFKEALIELHGQVDGKSGEEVGVKIKDALEGVEYNNKAVTSWRDELVKSPTSAKLKDLVKKLAPVSDKAKYSSFLAKLRVYTDQAHESQLDAMIKEQLNKVWICKDNLEADAMCYALQSQVKSWWQKDNVYLTQNSTLWLGVVKSQTERLSKSTIDGLTKFGLEFVESSLQDLHDRIRGVSGVLNLRVDSRTAASSLKVHQALAKFGAQENVLHVNLQAFLEREADVLAAWASRWCRVLVLECDRELEQSKAGRSAARIINFLDWKSEDKVLVLIAPATHELNRRLFRPKIYVRFHDYIGWGDLTKSARKVLMSTIIEINGSQVVLADLVSSGYEPFVNNVDMDVISQILQEDFRFGKDLNEGDKFFVTRRLREGDDGVPFVVNSVSDVRRKVVLVVAEPRMGKSTLITHLAKSSKAKDPTAWIVHIKLGECSKYLQKMDVELFNEVTARKFLEQSALSSENSLEKLLFSFLEDKLVVFIDGVDEVCPHYEEQVFTLLRFVKKLKFHQLWITSRPVFQRKLENALGVTSFQLIAFSEEDKIEFFNKVWKANVPSATPEKCQEATASLLTWLTDSLGKDNPILGVPLMAAMIAETFQDRMFTKDSVNLEFKTKERLDVMSLYKNFVEKKFLRYCVDKKKTANRDLAAIRHDEETFQKHMHHKHGLAALRVLLTPEEIAGLQFEGKEKFDQDLDAYLKEISEGREKTGIIDNVINGKPHFVHRSFAEHFASSWLACNFKENRKFIAHIIFDPAYKVLSEMFHRTLVSGHRLHDAVMSRDVQAVAYLLNLHPEPSFVNALDAGGRTPLHLAVMQSGTDPHPDWIRIVEILIQKHKARVDICDEVLGWQPLEYGYQAQAWEAIGVILRISKNDGGIAKNLNRFKFMDYLKHGGKKSPDPSLMLDAVKNAQMHELLYLLEERGGDLNCRGPQGEHLVHSAAEGGSVQILEYLTKKRLSLHVKDKRNNTTLHYATFGDSESAVDYLLEQRVDLEAVNSQGLNALQEAAQHGSYKVMANLIGKKTSFAVGHCANASKTQLNASLQCAAFAGDLRAVKKFVEMGADELHQNSKGNTAAWIAMHGGHVEVFDWVLLKGSKKGSTPLHEACRLGDSEIVSYLIAQPGADVDARGWQGETPLLAATKGGHLEVIKLLLENGAKKGCQGADGNTLLHVAASQGNILIVTFLLSQSQAEKANSETYQTSTIVEAINKKGITPLLAALRGGHLDVAELLLTHGACVNTADEDGKTPLILSSSQGNGQAVEWLLSRGANADAVDNNGGTAMHASCLKGDLGVVKLLLSTKITVDLCDKDGNTPLHLASGRKSKKVVKLLLDNRADVNLKNNMEQTPLHAASQSGSSDVVKMLLENGASSTCTDIDGNTPLHLGSGSEHKKVVKLLLNHRADVNLRNNMGQTPLHAASRSGSGDVVKILLENNSNSQCQDEYGNTPLHLASMRKTQDVVQILLNFSVHVNVKNSMGQTPLHAAAQSGSSDVVKLLLANGASVESLDSDGNTPLYIASLHGNEQAVGMLLELNADVNFQRNDGETPLLAAARGKHENVTLMLFKEICYLKAENNFNTFNKGKIFKDDPALEDLMAFTSSAMHETVNELKSRLHTKIMAEQHDEEELDPVTKLPIIGSETTNPNLSPCLSFDRDVNIQTAKSPPVFIPEGNDDPTRTDTGEIRTSTGFSKVIERLEMLSSFNAEKLNRYELDFKVNYLKRFADVIPSDGVFSVLVKSRTTVSLIKVWKALTLREKRVSCSDLSALLENDEVRDAWLNEDSWDVSVIECTEEGSQSDISRLCESIMKVVEKNSKSKLILVIGREDHALISKLKASGFSLSYKDSCYWSHISKKSQDRLKLSGKINLQGKTITLLKLGDKFLEKIDSEVLSHLLNQDTRCGKDLGEVTDGFIERRLKPMDGEEVNATSLLSDEADKVVLVVAKPGMGKSTLFTHLAKQAKEDNPSAWVVHIKLNECLRLLDKVASVSITASEFLHESAVAEGNALEKILFECLTNTMFIFVDGCDELCPQYLRETGKMLRLLMDLKIKKLFVSSRPDFGSELELHSGVKRFDLCRFLPRDQLVYLKISEYSFEEVSSPPQGTGAPYWGVPLITAMVAQKYKGSLSSHKELLDVFNTLDILSLFESIVATNLKQHADDLQLDVATVQGNFEHVSLFEVFGPDEMTALYLAGKYVPLSRQGSVSLSDGETKMESLLGTVDSNGVPGVVNRVFADYFAASWLANNWEANRVLVERVTSDPAFKGVRKLFAQILKKSRPEAITALNQVVEDKPVATKVKPDVSDIFGAARDGNVQLLKALFAEGTSLEVSDGEGFTLLHHAARHGQMHAVRILTELGLQENAKNLIKKTALQLAVSAGRSEVGSQRCLEVVKYLLCQRGLECGNSPIHIATREGYRDVVEFLVDKGADINWVNDLGQTPLHLAVQFNRPDLVDYLVRKGARCKPDKGGSLPLHVAASKGYVDVVNSLIKSEPDAIDCVDVRGRTALFVAVSENRRKVVEVLVGAGADKRGDSEGNGLLHQAAAAGNVDVVRFLVKDKCVVDGKDERGRTALYYARQHSQEDVQAILLEAGANAEG